MAVEEAREDREKAENRSAELQEANKDLRDEEEEAQEEAQEEEEAAGSGNEEEKARTGTGPAGEGEREGETDLTDSEPARTDADTEGKEGSVGEVTNTEEVTVEVEVVKAGGVRGEKAGEEVALCGFVGVE